MFIVIINTVVTLTLWQRTNNCITFIISGVHIPGVTLFLRSSFRPVREPTPAGNLPSSSPRLTTRSFSDTSNRQIASASIRSCQSMKHTFALLPQICISQYSATSLTVCFDAAHWVIGNDICSDYA